jgi:hypothetical protein
MTRLELISKSVRISAVSQAIAAAEPSIRLRRAQQHRFQSSAPGLTVPLERARSGTNGKV